MVRPLLVLFMLVFVSSTVSLPVLVCASVEGGLEGVDSLGTGMEMFASPFVSLILVLDIYGCVATLNHWWS